MQLIDRFFAWHRKHHVTGVEAMHIPLLVISVIVLSSLDQQVRARGLFRSLDQIAPLMVWALALLTIAVTLLMSLLTYRTGVQRWMLGLTASWWFLVSLLIWQSGSTWLTPAVYSCIGVSALFRVAEQSFREVTTRDGSSGHG